MTTLARTARGVRLGIVAALVGAVVASAAPSASADDVPIFPGSLPDAASAATVTGRGPAGDLSVHISQTSDLTSQGVSLSWSWPGHDTVSGFAVDGAGTSTVSDSGSAEVYLGNYLQVMQCWGDPVTQTDVDTATGDAKVAAEANFVADNPGPPREQCEYGGTAQGRNIPGLSSVIQNSRSAGGVPTTGAGAKTYYGDEAAYPADPSSFLNNGGWSFPEVPFKAVDGVVTRNSNPNQGSWANNYFGRNTTNEVPVAPVTGGSGGVTFQAQNSLDAPGLGCGATTASGSGYNKCWLVIVPRTLLTTVGDTATFNARKNAIAGVGASRTVLSGPLASTLWANRIAVPMDFRPTLDACANAAETYQTVGSELPQSALLSWQAALCRTGGSETGYNYTFTPDSIARQALQSGSDSMRLLSNPVPTEQVFDPVTYAPLTLSGISVSYVFEPALLGFSPPVTAIKLNPRLVAKLVTQSYRSANVWRLNPTADGTPAPSAYSWLAGNPDNLWLDPEFQALNPDVAAAIEAAKEEVGTDTWTAGTGANGYLQVNGTGSDAYTAVWKWILSNDDARAFLAGSQDGHGMTVDPYYSTNAALNPSGAAFDPASLDYFPSLDPWQGDPFGYVKQCQYPQPNNPVVGTIDLDPFAQNFGSLARNIVRVDPLNKATQYNCALADGSPFNPDAAVGWRGGYTAPLPGQRRMLGLTDTASSSQYGVVAASLLNDGGQYVAPTTASLQAAASHLTYGGGVKGVGQPDPASSDPAAYPLSLITYAAVQTNDMDTAACAAYANLLTYASSSGQESGAEVGKLPFGYAPLSTTLRQQTADAARTVAACAKTEDGQAPTEETPPADTSTDQGGSTDGGGDVTVPDAPSDLTAGGATAAPSSPTVSLASNRGTTKPDPSVFAWVVPIALGVGFLAVLGGPLAGLRRRRPDQTPPGGRG